MRIRVANGLVVASYATMAIATGWAFQRHGLAEQQQMVAVQRQLAASAEVRRFLDGSRHLTSSVQSYAVTGDPFFADAYWRELYAVRRRERAANALQRLGLTPEERTLLQRARFNSDALVPREEEALQARGRGDREQALRLVFGEGYQQSLRRIADPSERLQNRMTARMAAAVETARREAEWFWQLCLSLLLIDVVLVAVVLLVIYPRFVTEPLLRLDRRIQQRIQGEPVEPLALGGVAREICDLANSLQAQEAMATRLRQERWVKAQLARIGALLQKQDGPNAVARCCLQELAPLLQVGAATLYGRLANQGTLQRLASYGAANEASIPETMPANAGLIGSCIDQGRTIDLADPPPGYLRVFSGLGSADPNALWILPIQAGERVIGVIELGLLRPLETHERELVTDLLPLVALALETVMDGGRNPIAIQG